MRRSKLIVFTAIILMAFGCASSDPDPPPTEVDGMVVADGEEERDYEFTDEEIAQFAEAYVEVMALEQQYEVQIQEADESEREQLAAERDERAEEAIEASGMTSEEFNTIAVLVPRDEELRARVHEAIQQRDEQRIEETERQLESP